MVMTQIPTPKQIVNNPEQFSSTFLKILNKDKKLVPFRWNKAQRDFHSKRTGRDLILKARQLGFTTYIQGELFRRAVTNTVTSITLTHENKATTKLRLMVDRFYDNCRFGTIQPERKYANAELATYPEFDSSCIIATAGSVNTGRGDTYTDLHGSEVAFWSDAESIMAGAMQGGNPDVVLESTPNGAQGYFYELCMEALGGDSVWTLHFYAWWWDEAYQLPLANSETIEYDKEESKLVEKNNLTPEQIKWRRRKKKELKDKFTQEYPEDPITCFLTSGNSYFFTGIEYDVIEDIFSAPLDVEYNSEHEYYSGLDWGQSNDFTDMPVLDATTKEQVDLLHINKLAWKEQRNRIEKFYNKWNIKALGCEMNSIGSVNFEALLDMGLNVIPFTTNNETKADICSDLYEAIHTNGWKLQNIPLVKHQMQTFISTQLQSGVWRLAASGEGHDDIVIGLAIAKWAILASRIQIF
jgi:hypothetical protein